jgi:hypothetical protein
VISRPRFDFEHINLIPKKCIVESRNECDTSIQFGKHRFKLPVGAPTVLASVACGTQTGLRDVEGPASDLI